MSNIYILSNAKDKIENINYLNIFDIKYISSNIDLNIYDALIFTSKNAIKALDSFNNNYKKYDCYAIANKTADVLNEYSCNVKYIGKASNGNDFANEIKDKLKNKKVLYVRAKKVVSNLSEILNNNSVFCDELISYETICKKYENNNKPKKDAIIIFTSPSSIKCFLNNFTWDFSYKAVCIGNTTASYLPKDIKAYISKHTSIDACIKLAKELI